MRSLLYLMLLCWMPFRSYSQYADTAGKIRNNTLKVIQEFRTHILRLPDAPIYSQLLANTTDLYEITRTVNDTSELNGIRRYIYRANYSLFVTTDSSEQVTIASAINEDLDLKLHLDQQRPLNWQTGADSFGKEYPFTVTAYINGAKQNTGQYRLYWQTFVAKDQESLIKEDHPDGSSDRFENPYSIVINLPGVITFWLKDTQNNKYYKSDFKQKRLTGNITKLDITFVPLP
jgi:hypothetical protein